MPREGIASSVRRVLTLLNPAFGLAYFGVCICDVFLESKQWPLIREVSVDQDDGRIGTVCNKAAPLWTNRKCAKLLVPFFNALRIGESNQFILYRGRSILGYVKEID